MSVRLFVSAGLLPALLFAHPAMAQTSASSPSAQAVPKDGPCSLCADPEAKRLQQAWDSGATTAAQKEMMGQIVAENTSNGRTIWGAAADSYFRWRKTQPDAVSASPVTQQASNEMVKRNISKPVDPSNVWASVTDEYGPEPTDVLPAIRAAAMGYLKDPDSGQYQIQNLFKGYCRNGWLNGNKVAWKGWAVNVMINGKNSYGGYTGYTPATVLLEGNGGRILDGFNFGAYGPRKGLLGGGAGVCQIEKQ